MRIREAMANALYGPQGFFRREQPRDHFRTSALASPLFARALARLIAEVDEALGNPDDFTVVDIGAGRGELLTALIAGQRRTTRWVAVEKAGRPEHLDERVQWLTEPPPQVTGVVLACEWLDNIPLDLVEVDDEGLIRYVEVDGVFGEPVDAADGEWLAKWWPIAEPGEVAEIGLTRDDAWNRAVSALHRGLAVAIDYGHLRDERPWTGTLTGFRAGREVAPAYDGSTDITAHVAFDSLGGGVLITQREALHRLGVDGSRPPVALASSDPAGTRRIHDIRGAVHGVHLRRARSRRRDCLVRQPQRARHRPAGPLQRTAVRRDDSVIPVRHQNRQQPGKAKAEDWMPSAFG